MQRDSRSQYLSLIAYKTYAELRSEAARTYAGFLWWVIEPILNMAVYYYDKIPGQGIGGWTRVDAGLTWRPNEDVEISLWGQNLLDNKHPEYGPDGFVSNASTEVPRGVYAQVKLRL